MEYTASEKAYTRSLLHTVKFSSHHVNGILLGTKLNSSIQILDAIPLFHTRHSLTPALEIAITVIEQHALKNKMEIVGYYFTTDMLESNLHTHNTILEKMRENYPYCVSWKIINEKWPNIIADKNVTFEKVMPKEELIKLDTVSFIDFEMHLDNPKMTVF